MVFLEEVLKKEARNGGPGGLAALIEEVARSSGRVRSAGETQGGVGVGVWAVGRSRPRVQGTERFYVPFKILSVTPPEKQATIGRERKELDQHS